jgi:GNAT superfamily N-acetyltransferase
MDMVAAYPYEIRQAREYDRRQIMDVNRQAWRAAYSHIYSFTEMEGLFNNRLVQRGSWTSQRDQRLEMLVAERHAKIVGFIGLGKFYDGSGEITTFYVHPNHQAQGIGTRLWQSALDGLRDHDCSEAWVWVLARAKACQFYEAQGCVHKDEGIYRIGDHEERALGYWIAL